jgi:hypothetical protein
MDALKTAQELAIGTPQTITIVQAAIQWMGSQASFLENILAISALNKEIGSIKELNNVLDIQLEPSRPNVYKFLVELETRMQLLEKYDESFNLANLAMTHEDPYFTIYSELMMLRRLLD